MADIDYAALTNEPDIDYAALTNKPADIDYAALTDIEDDFGSNIEGSKLSGKTTKDISMIKDVGMAAANGLYNGFRSASDLVANLTYSAITGEEYKSLTADDDVVGDVLPKSTYKPSSATASVTETVAQVGSGFMIGGPLFKGIAKGVQGAKFLTKATPLLKGMFVDGVAFSQDEQNLSDMLSSLDNKTAQTIGDFLNKDDDDGFYEARLKNTVEGLVIGGAVDSVVGAFKYMKTANKGSSIVKETTKKIDEITASNSVSAEFKIQRDVEATKIEAVKNRARARISSNYTDEQAEAILKDANVGAVAEEIVPYLDNEARVFEKSKPVLQETVKAIDDGLLTQEQFRGTVSSVFNEMFSALGKTQDAISSSALGLRVVGADQTHTSIKKLNKYVLENASKLDMYGLAKQFSELGTDDLVPFVDALGKNVDKYKNPNSLWDNVMYLRANLLLTQAATYARDVISTSGLYALNKVETAAAGGIGALRNSIPNIAVKSTDIKPVKMAKESVNWIKNTLLGSGEDMNRVYAGEAFEGLDVYLGTVTESLVNILKRGDVTGTKEFTKKFSNLGDAYNIQGRGLDPRAFGLKEGSWHADALKHLDKNLPISYMQRKDDVLQAAAFYSGVKQRAYRYAKKQASLGKDVNINDMKKALFNSAIEVDFDNPTKHLFSDNAVAHSIANEAFAESQELTFRNDLSGSSKAIYDAMNSQPIKPLFDILIPFKKVPITIQFDRFIGDRTAIPLFSDKTRMRQALRAGGAEGDMVRGRLATSFAITTAATKMYLDGRLAPDFGNDKARDVLLARGIQPNSMKIGDKWYDVSKFSPMSSYFTVAANVAHTVKTYGEDLDDESKLELTDLQYWTSIGIASGLGVVKASTNSSYLDDVKDILTTYQDVDVSGTKKLLERLVPAPGIIGEVVGAIKDPFIDETEQFKQYSDGVMQRIWVRMGGKTKNQLDLFGEPIPASDKWAGFLPMQSNVESKDVVTKAMIEANAFVEKPRRRTQFLGVGVELTPEQVYKWQENMGNNNAKGKLERVINSPLYKALPNTERTLDGGTQFTKGGLLKSLYNELKKQAFNELLKTDPELKERITNTARTETVKKVTPRFNVVTPSLTEFKK